MPKISMTSSASWIFFPDFLAPSKEVPSIKRINTPENSHGTQEWRCTEDVFPFPRVCIFKFQLLVFGRTKMIWLVLPARSLHCGIFGRRTDWVVLVLEIYEATGDPCIHYIPWPQKWLMSKNLGTLTSLQRNVGLHLQKGNDYAQQLVKIGKIPG